MFFQVHADEIQELPEVLADRVYLLPDVLQKSRADSTNKKYSSAFLRFHKWALCNELGSGDILPAKIFPVAIYLASLIQTANSPGPVITAFYAIKWFHDLYGFESPTNSKLVVNILEASKRILSKPIKRTCHYRYLDKFIFRVVYGEQSQITENDLRLFNRVCWFFEKFRTVGYSYF